MGKIYIPIMCYMMWRYSLRKKIFEKLIKVVYGGNEL
jgi:hypothetical protein